MESPLDHVFTNYQVNIMQSCDQCLSYIWGMEKAYMCSCELPPYHIYVPILGINIFSYTY